MTKRSPFRYFKTSPEIIRLSGPGYYDASTRRERGKTMAIA
nr:hypothetical protein [Roseovarius marisflavi]